MVVSQAEADPGGWVIEIYAEFHKGVEGAAYIGKVTLSAMTAAVVANVRVVALATLGGAVRWRAVVRPPANATKRLQVALVANEVTGVGLTNVVP